MTGQVATARQHRAVQAWVRLRASDAAMTRAFNASLVAEFGLTVNDFEVLRRLSLEAEGRMRRVDLAQVVSLTPSGITRLLDGLERAGLVRKDVCTEDARVTYARITPGGTARWSRRPRATWSRSRASSRSASAPRSWRRSASCWAACRGRPTPTSGAWVEGRPRGYTRARTRRREAEMSTNDDEEERPRTASRTAPSCRR